MECGVVKLRIGQILLTLTFLSLLIGSILHTDMILSIVLLIVVIFLSPLIFKLYKEIEDNKVDIQSIIFTALGSLLTFILHRETMLTPVSASALIGIVGYFIKKDQSLGIYAGSFAGMIGPMFTYPEAIIVSILVGVVYMFSTKSYLGFGGRLGTIGLTATLIGAFLFDHIYFDVTVLNQHAYIGIILFGVIGGALTYFIQHQFNLNPVFASGVVGLIFGLIVPELFTFGAIYAIVVFQNSFIGMASKTRLNNLFEALIASLIGSLLFIILFPYFQSLGGKFGTTAMISVLIIYQFKKLVENRFTLIET
jgi:hypothetical protein